MTTISHFLYRIHIVLAILLSICTTSFGQEGIGLRFATNLNYFPQPSVQNLISNWFSTGVFGIHYNQYKKNHGFEVGLNLQYKNGDDSGFPNLPVVMEDFGDGQGAGLTSIEMDLKVGPRFKFLYPRIGYILGYRFEATGFQSTPTLDINAWYLTLPFGSAAIFPTNFGTVGVGAYYYVGVTNVLKNPDSNNNGNIPFDGGRMRSINLEITVSYQSRRGIFQRR